MWGGGGVLQSAKKLRKKLAMATSIFILCDVSKEERLWKLRGMAMMKAGPSLANKDFYAHIFIVKVQALIK